MHWFGDAVVATKHGVIEAPTERASEAVAEEAGQGGAMVAATEDHPGQAIAGTCPNPGTLCVLWRRHHVQRTQASVKRAHEDG